MTLQIKYKQTSELIPYLNNSRTHSESQVAQIAASVREFGFTNPILIDDQGTIIAGHGRVMAAQKLGLAEVPTITLQGLTEAQRKAYVIADNKLALNAGWDAELLKLEIETLQELNFNLDVLGFDADELNLLFNGWESDVELPEEKQPDGLIKLGIKVTEESGAFAKETITNALDSAGIDYELA